MQYASLMSVESPSVGATKRGRSLEMRLAGGVAVLVAAMLSAWVVGRALGRMDLPAMLNARL